MVPFGTATRRGLLAGVGAAGLVPAAGLLAAPAWAKLAAGLGQAPYFYRFKLGTAECTVVTDGQLPLGDPNVAFLNIPKDEIARELRDNFLPTGNAVLEQNVLVVTSAIEWSCSTPEWAAMPCLAQRQVSSSPPCARRASTPQVSMPW